MPGLCLEYAWLCLESISYIFIDQGTSNQPILCLPFVWQLFILFSAPIELKLPQATFELGHLDRLILMSPNYKWSLLCCQADKVKNHFDFIALKCIGLSAWPPTFLFSEVAFCALLGGCYIMPGQ